VTGYRSEISVLLHDGCSMLWIDFKIHNFVFVAAKPEQCHYGTGKDKYGLVENKHFDVYSCYPYEGGKCGYNLQAASVDRCYDENYGNHSYNISLFPNKIPNNFAGCVVTVLIISVKPYVMGVNESIDLYKNAKSIFRGLEVENLLHVTEVLNVTAELSIDFVHFFPLRSVHKIGLMVEAPESILLLDASIPYIIDFFKWYIPCPKPVQKMEKFWECPVHPSGSLYCLSFS
jgi:hypothetical protein